MVALNSVIVPLAEEVISQTQEFAGIVASLNEVVVAPESEVTVRLDENTLLGVPEFLVDA